MSDNLIPHNASIMNIKSTIIVFILAVASVISAVAVERNDRRAEAAEIDTTVDLLPASFDVNDVDHITLQRGDETLVFARDETGWWQTSPFRYPMDPFSIRQLVVLASELRVLDVIETQPDDASTSLAALRLDPPAATLTFGWGDESASLHLGRRGVAGRAYLRRADAPTVYVVDAKFHDRAIDMDDREWRDRAIFRGIDADANMITRVQGDVTLVLARETQQWEMRKPAVTRADPEAMSALLSDIARMQVGGFVLDEPDDLASFGLEAPIATLEIQSSARVVTDAGTEIVPKTQRLLVGAQAAAGTQDRFAMVDGQPVVFRLPAAAIIQVLLQPVEYLIDARGSGAAPADVKSLVIRHDGSELRLVRHLEEWKYERGEDILTVPYAYVEQLLQQLTTLRAPRIVRRPYPQDAEVAVITMYGYDRRPLDTVRLVRDPDSQEWALENGDNVLRILGTDVEWKLTPADYGLDG
ncbi:MAG: DUF4340 domain-containing protein [Phycisphaerales bacterium]|nr:DUF4340 domain-containing protein [Phycisphaerales bacterium]